MQGVRQLLIQLTLEVAKKLGVAAAQEVPNAMERQPSDVRVPTHYVVSDGVADSKELQFLSTLWDLDGRRDLPLLRALARKAPAWLLSKTGRAPEDFSFHYPQAGAALHD